MPVQPRTGLRALGRSAAGKARVIALANQKGGVAKTTSTVNLAVALTERGPPRARRRPRPAVEPHDVAGLRPGAARAVDVRRARAAGMPITDVIIQHAEFDVAVASIDLAGAELALGLDDRPRARAREGAARRCSADYDEILIDTPPSLGLITVNALTASDGVIVPVQCEYLSLRGLVQLEDTLQMIRENLNPRRAASSGSCRRCTTRASCMRARRRAPRGELRRARLQDAHPQDDSLRRGAREGPIGAAVRTQGQAAEAYRTLAEEVLEREKRRASMREGPLADLFRQTDGQYEPQSRRPAETPPSVRPAAAARRRSRPTRRSPIRAARARSRSRRSRGRARGRSAQRVEAEPARARLRAVPDPGDVREAADGVRCRAARDASAISRSSASSASAAPA